MGTTYIHIEHSEITRDLGYVTLNMTFKCTAL